MSTLAEPISMPNTAEPGTPQVVVCLPAFSPESLQTILATLTAAFPNGSLLIVSPNDAPGLTVYPTPRPSASWVLTAADYAAAASLTSQHPEANILLLGDDPTFAPETLHHLIHCVRSQGIDLALPRYTPGPSRRSSTPLSSTRSPAPSSQPTCASPSPTPSRSPRAWLPVWLPQPSVKSP